jgi:hypothetical protein
MPYKCCDHCVADPAYHKDNPPDSHDVTCSTDPVRRPCGSGGDTYVPAHPGGETT